MGEGWGRGGDRRKERSHAKFFPFEASFGVYSKMLVLKEQRERKRKGEGECVLADSWCNTRHPAALISTGPF